MDFIRTLKKRRPKSHVKRGLSTAPTTGHKPKSRRIHTRRRRTALKLAFCLALFLALAVVTQGQAEDYYFYKGPKGELVISNKEPPPGSQIIKRVPGAADRKTPQSQEPTGRNQPSSRQNVRRNPPRTNSHERTQYQHCKLSSYRTSRRDRPGPIARFHRKGVSV